MKKLMKLLSIFLFLLVGTYFTANIVNILEENDEIMQQIKLSKNKYEVKPVNAIIEGNEITPGKYGVEIDYKSSYRNMKKYGTYNESLTVLKEDKPDISSEKSYDRYIKRGNSNNRNVSLIFKLEEDKDVSKLIALLEKKGVAANFFVDGSILEKNINLIRSLENHEVEILSYKNTYDEILLKTSFSYLEAITNKESNYCYTEKENAELLKICTKLKLHTVLVEKVIQDNLYKTVKETLDNSQMYTIEEYTIDELSSTIDYIKSKGYNLVTLKCLLSENVC